MYSLIFKCIVFHLKTNVVNYFEKPIHFESRNRSVSTQSDPETIKVNPTRIGPATT